MVETDVAILGTGFSGIGAAITLQQAGRTDFVILEKADDVGGTWRDNTYPGAECDVQSHLYSFSFEKNPRWTREFSAQPEILDYLRGMADKHALPDRITFGTEVQSLAWDEEALRWTIRTSGETYRARVVIDGLGFLHIPSIPDIAGSETFAGPRFHSARWDHGVDLAGKRVAMIGTGASAIQIVPAIAPEVARLDVFMRTPPWPLFKLNHDIDRVRRFAFAHVPGAATGYRLFEYWMQEVLGWGMLHRAGRPMVKGLEFILKRRIKRTVTDPAIAEKLTPDYQLGCKRTLRTDTWLPSFNRNNVALVTDSIAEITPTDVRTADGTEHEVDVIIYGTGFHVVDGFEFKNVTGRAGADLAKIGREQGAEAFNAGIAGFPNYFLMMGPNTNQGHTSNTIAMELQFDWILRLLDEMEVRGAEAVEPTEQAQRQFNDWLQDKLKNMVWTAGGCTSWYVDADGVNRSMWPGGMPSYRRHMRRFDETDFTWHAAPSA